MAKKLKKLPKLSEKDLAKAKGGIDLCACSCGTCASC